ncbi:MAG: J domain-containing protein [Pseudomonadota bacterium]
MARNPYSVLGVAPSASDSDIRAAFRKLAKQYHPDRNPDNPKAEDKFKEISAAFEIIGDTQQRRKFDRGEIDEDGRERGPQFNYRDFRSANGGGNQTFGQGQAGDFADLSDIFADLFGARPRDGRSHGFQNPNARGRDLRYRLEVEFLDAALGAKKKVTMPDGRTLNISVPAALENGQTLRLKGQGESLGSGAPGDVYVEVKIKPHPVFDRDGLDIHVEAPISLREAVLGGRITVPTIGGDVSVTVPKNANSGTVLRLKGRGISPPRKGAPGDQLVKLKIVLPEGGDPELEEFVRQWKGGQAHAPRRDFAGA